MLYISHLNLAQRAGWLTASLARVGGMILPPHKLRLREGMPIMLLRNLNGARGLANGTRLIKSKRFKGMWSMQRSPVIAMWAGECSFHISL